MKVRTMRNRLVLAIGLCALVLGCTAYPSVGGPPATAAANVALPAALDDAVTEWNQEAARLTLSGPPTVPAALAPVEQTRVMAIVQAAVHDAVSGITGEYATYLSPGPAPAGASAEAAAVAAAHRALRGLFAGLSIEETAEVLDVSPGTVMRDWTFTKAWLMKEISGGE